MAPTAGNPARSGRGRASEIVRLGGGRSEDNPKDLDPQVARPRRPPRIDGLVSLYRRRPTVARLVAAGLARCRS